MTNDESNTIDTLKRQVRDAQQAEAAGRVREINLQQQMLAYQGLATQTILFTRSFFQQVKDRMTIEEVAALQESIAILQSLHASIRKDNNI